MRRLLALAALVLWISPAQIDSPGPQVSTFLSDVDDSDQPYGLYLPANFDRARKYPLVISLHGAGSNHRLNLRRVFGQGNRMGETDAEATRRFPALRNVDYIVASPLARGTMGYQGVAERDVYAVLDDVKKRFSIDEDRIYLTGLSMGGGGTLWLGLTRPDLWAAIAPVCPAPPSNAEELAGNALNIPIKMFQGAADPLVKPETVRAWQKRFVDSEVQSEYIEYPAVRHNAWDSAYKDGAIFNWFDKYKRNAFPNRVRFAALDYKHSSAYWVRFDLLTPGEMATLDVRFEGKNALRIETAGLDAFTLQLKGHPMFSPGRPVLLTVDGTTLRSKPAAPISVSRSGAKWVLKLATPGAAGKRAGAEGPLAAAFAARQVYVYGTGGSPSADELIRRRDQATQAADWSTPRSRLLVNFRVVSDAEVKDSEMEGANLILFGSKETNSLIARYAPRLPLALNPGAADFGLVYVYPVDGRYVVVSSGLPWWTRMDQVSRTGFNFAAPKIRPLLNFGDYVLFKGGIDSVVAEGRFDRKWSLTSEAVTPLLATGAVEVRH